MRQLFLLRDVFGPTWTLGRLFLDGRFYCFTCEDLDRRLRVSMGEFAIARAKAPGTTAIPATEGDRPYTLSKRWSERHGREVIGVEGVPAWRNVELHEGNDDGDTLGCVVLGLKRDVNRGRVLESRPAVTWLEQHLMTTLPTQGGELAIVWSYAR